MDFGSLFEAKKKQKLTGAPVAAQSAQRSHVLTPPAEKVSRAEKKKLKIESMARPALQAAWRVSPSPMAPTLSRTHCPKRVALCPPRSRYPSGATIGCCVASSRSG